MNEFTRKCKGVTKKGKPCNKYPSAGDDFCDKHHPAKKYKRWLKGSIILNIIQFAFAILLFLIGQYNGNRSDESIKEEVRKNSVADRILKNQYNPAKLSEIFNEILNLMNNDPEFRKTFFIDNKGIGIETQPMVYGKDFRIDFNENASSKFQDFMNSGRKSITINAKDYKYYYTLKNGEAIDSFCNSTFTYSRNFPVFPVINISTLNPTGEYLCTNPLNIQIDSILGHMMYMSNINQNNTFKIRLRYDYDKDIASFDQLKDIYFDFNSSFYSIDQEISYYEFLNALFHNACILIRNGLTGDTIKITEPYLPVNMDGDQTITSLNNKIAILEELKIIQNRWQVNFNRSNINEEELAYINCIRHSLYTCSEITEYPFKVTIPKDDADRIVGNRSLFEKSIHKIICNYNRVSILGKEIQLGRLAVEIPPAKMTFSRKGNKVFLEFNPINNNEMILFEFTDIKDSNNPAGIIYGDYSPLNDDPSIYFVKEIQIQPESWRNTKAHKSRLEFSEFVK
jgi:hypothetical protein